MHESTGQGISPVQARDSPGMNSSPGESGSSGPCAPPPKKKTGSVVAGAVSSQPVVARIVPREQGSPNVQVYSISGDSSPEEEEDISQMTEDQLHRDFQAASAASVSPLGYDSVVSVPLPSSNLDQEFQRASATFLNPMGYDEVLEQTPGDTAGSRDATSSLPTVSRHNLVQRPSSSGPGSANEHLTENEVRQEYERAAAANVSSIGYDLPEEETQVISVPALSAPRYLGQVQHIFNPIFEHSISGF